MEELKYYAMVIALWGGIFDLCTNKIPNWITFTAMFIGLCVNFILFKWTGLYAASLGIMLGFALYIPMYFFKIMGGGDVKLLMALGAFGGPRFCFAVGIMAIIVGGFFALLDTISVGRFIPVLKTSVQFFRSLFIQVLVVEPMKLDENRKFSFGLAIALAAVIVIWLGDWGKLLWPQN